MCIVHVISNVKLYHIISYSSQFLSTVQVIFIFYILVKQHRCRLWDVFTEQVSSLHPSTHTHLCYLSLIVRCVTSGHRSGVGKFHPHMQTDQLTYRTSERESKREDLSDVVKGQHYEKRLRVANSDTGVRWNLGRQDVKRSYFVRIAVAVCHHYG